MSNWPPTSEGDDELRAADEVLGKADALLRRHAPPPGPAPMPPDALEFIALEDEDLPVLTEVVDPDELAQAAPPEPAARAPSPPKPRPVSELAEQLISLDTEIARAVESWFATELPQLLDRELQKLAHRLQEEAAAHLRATLLPTLSAHISRSLEKNASLDEPSNTPPA